jgi:hypothetical protein
MSCKAGHVPIIKMMTFGLRALTVQAMPMSTSPSLHMPTILPSAGAVRAVTTTLCAENL